MVPYYMLRTGDMCSLFHPDEESDLQRVMTPFSLHMLAIFIDKLYNKRTMGEG